MIVNTRPSAASARHPSGVLVTVLAVATGSLVANLYYAQPLVGSIGPAVGLSPALAGLVVSVTQIGYGLGLFFLVSLADLVENKRLVLTMLVLTTLGLAGMALARDAAPFFAASIVVGVCSTGAQILLPFTAQLIPVERRGRVVGNVMAAVLSGIMLARPVALIIASTFGWRAVFWWSVGLMLTIGTALAALMPKHQPRGGMHYGQILGSMARLVRERPPVLWRAAYQALMFAAFNLFWTAAPLMLVQRFGLDEHAIALFALAGAGGALSAPFAGRLADRGQGVVATAFAMGALTLCFALTAMAVEIRWLILLVIMTIMIDASVQTNQVVCQRTIFAVPSEIRGRINAVFMTISFAGGALGSVLGTLSFHLGGWSLTAAAGALIGVINLGLLALESSGQRRGPVSTDEV